MRERVRERVLSSAICLWVWQVGVAYTRCLVSGPREVLSGPSACTNRNPFIPGQVLLTGITNSITSLYLSLSFFGQ